jgi:branched-chain amino acid transport system ATP-binding protein
MTTATTPATEAPPRRVLFTLWGQPVRKPRAPKRYLAEATAGYPTFPLLVLFGLNAVDELDRTAFGIVGPEIRDSFGFSNGGFLTLVLLTLAGGLLLTIPLGYYADRLPRVPIAVAGAAVWSVFGLMTGFATTLLMLVIARTGTGMGRAVVEPTHNSLLADYYPLEVRPDVYGFHRMANAIGQCIGPLLGGILAAVFGWRAPFIVFFFPSVILVVIAMRLKEPGRGHFERAAAGADQAVIDTDEEPPTWAESMRILWQVRTLRRIWFSLPFLAGSIIGLLVLTSLFYDEIFGLSELQRGVVAAAAEPASVLGIILGIPLASRLMLKDPGAGLKYLSFIAMGIAGIWIAFATAPVLWVAIAANVLISGLASLLAPGIFASLSLAIPPKVRAVGYSVSAVFVLPGLLLLTIVGSIADDHGLRWGLLVMVPIFLVGAFILSSASMFVKQDINRVWTSTAAQAEVKYQRARGEVKLLLVRNVDVSYDNVQVLFGVNLEVDEGEIIALLGTNGAGKSTLLKAIAGIVPADGGAIVFDGRDATYTPPYEIAARGITMVPGGQGVFPSLTVAENLRLAGWLNRDRRERADAVDRALEQFPVLRDRLPEPAANLSGGQQQMLTLAMALLSRPRLLMIDELSLGLAPSIVAELLEAVKRLKEQGTTVILVEQSVNVALTVADTAYFMEKGEIRFKGPTAELLERPDVLRSVFLEGAATIASEPAEPTVTVREAEPAVVPGRNGDHATRLEVDGVSKRFGGIAALSEVSFDVAAGEILGFLGPNGAGKTTLFDVLCGFLRADRGDVILEGKSIARLSPDARARAGLGRSFQDGRLFPALTVWETIAVACERNVDVRDPIAAALYMPSVFDSERKVNLRVEELIELLGLGAFHDKYMRELSTGSRRVVDLACVLAHGPSVLLLDEPSSGIAQKEAEALGPLLLRIRAMTGASILVIEHDVPLLTSVADRMIALDLGEVAAIGTPSEVVHDPRVVASYLGQSEQVVARSGTRIETLEPGGNGNG